MYLYIIILISSFVITYLLRYIALKRSILDVPNERSSHTVPTPRGGGLAIVITWYAGISFLYLNNDIDNQLFFALLSGLPVIAASLIDDVVQVNYLVRLGSQGIASALALYYLGGLRYLDLGIVQVNSPVVLTIIAFTGIVWFINLYNFIDGIDGYAATEAIFISLAIFALFGDFKILVLAFAVSGFLFWNWQKAKIFMGDVGSTMLGFTFPVFAIYYQNSNTSSLLVWAILSSLFWFDATFTLFRRFRNKESLSCAHKKHGYQRYVQAGNSHGKTVLWSAAINLFMFLAAYCSIIYQKAILLFFLLIVFICYMIMRYIDKKNKFD